jgi:rod shape determining protein RodA
MNRRGSMGQRFINGLFWPGTPVIIVLAGLGFLSVWSASYRSAEFGRGYYMDFYVKQAIWIAVGAGVFIACIAPARKTLSEYSPIVYIAGMLGLVSVMFFGTCINGSKRWLVLGPVHVQPSEFMKIGVAMALAAYLSKPRRLDRYRDLAVPFAIAFLPMAFILRQPDLGTSLLVVPILLTQLYVAGASTKKLAAVVLALAMMAPVSYFTLLKDYQKKRVNAFLFQGRYTKEQKIGEAYQLIQSKVAVGSGGATGKGWKKGTQNLFNFTPFRHTDFIFAVIGEEWGFLGAVGILALYLLAFSLAIALAFTSSNPYDRILISGLVTALCIQVFINTAMAVGLAPITGLTLPLISYGGSSMVTSFASFGLIAGARGVRSGDFSLRPALV